MKKYSVLRVAKAIVTLSGVVFTTDNKENAVKYAQLMRDENPDDEYAIVERLDD